MMENVEQKTPGERVESSRQIELEEHTWLPSGVNLVSKLSDQQEVIVQVVALDEC
jgi:hypothetical protein